MTLRKFYTDDAQILMKNLFASSTSPLGLCTSVNKKKSNFFPRTGEKGPEGVGVYLYSFFNLDVRWAGRSAPRYGRLTSGERDPALLYVYASWVREEEMHKSAASSDSLVSVTVANSVSRGFMKLSWGFQAINLLCFTNTKRNL